MATFWRCRICGYVAHGAAPPRFCPVCGATSEFFDPFQPPNQGTEPGAPLPSSTTEPKKPSGP
ncbi:MAG TPA: hypothetical protein P5137_02450 [Candidatus Brocadiia bacterium]|nr:hypothetical protein [Candidatus Brocadiia bacterium]